MTEKESTDENKLVPKLLDLAFSYGNLAEVDGHPIDEYTASVGNIPYLVNPKKAASINEGDEKFEYTPEIPITPPNGKVSASVDKNLNGIIEEEEEPEEKPARVPEVESKPIPVAVAVTVPTPVAETKAPELEVKASQELDPTEPKEAPSTSPLTAPGSTKPPTPLLRTYKPINATPIHPINATVIEGGAVRKTNPILDQVVKVINSLLTNDEKLTDLDLHDCPVFVMDHAVSIGKSLATNTHLNSINLSNLKLQNQAAIEIANGMKVNKSVQLVNLENNLFGPQGMKAIAEMLEVNRSLKELRLGGQKVATGTDAEQAFTRAMEKNTVITKITLAFRDVSSRNMVDASVRRNKDLLRKMNLMNTEEAAGEEQQTPN